MAMKRSTAGQQALDKALGSVNPTNDLNRKVLQSLNLLQATRLKLVTAFEHCAEQREAQAAKLKREARAAAEAALKMQRVAVANYNKSLGKTQDLTHLFESNLKGAELGVEIAKLSASSHDSRVASANINDNFIFNWIDEFTSHSVAALFNNMALDRAIAVLSGGLILAGLTGGIYVPIAAALASAAILAADVNSRLTVINREKTWDQEAARKERAVVLIDSANELSNRLLEILQS